MREHYTEPEFSIVSELVVHQRYLTLFNRRIRFPAVEARPEVEYDYDIVGHPQADFHFCVTFPFHPLPDGQRGGEVTLLREHCQGPNKMMFVLPTGSFDPKRHGGREACARAELSEEAHLAGGEWQRLLPADHAGLAEVKWSPNRFTPFLCIGPQADGMPGARDAEEFIEVHRVGLAKLRALMTGGDMLLPSVATCFLALDRLRCLGHID
ncbi:hypothetical protein WJX81_005907 [Elliptochloris bilobata]|uniref:Nudix hydrolase domain-containing protein n=1 Tax=Elliptochloris bilobata TaxID=381761 RepID=A0AAW1SDQ3_9CHLO